MRGAGAARQEQEPPPLPDGHALAVQAQALYGEQAKVLARIQEIGERLAAAGHGPDAEGLLRDLIREVLLDNRRGAELRKAVQDCERAWALSAPAYQAAYERGRRDEAARIEAGQAGRTRPPRARHARGNLRIAGNAAVKATAVAAAAVTATTAIAAHDSASVRHWAAAASRPASVRLVAAPPDQAVRMPQPRVAPPSRPSAAVKSATPAPPAGPIAPVSSSPPPAAPPPSATAPADPAPALLVSVRDLDLSGPSGSFQLTATGDPVEWSAETDIPGASIDVRQGVLSSAQGPVTITVTVPPGSEAGFVYVKWPGGGIASVWVTPAQ